MDGVPRSPAFRQVLSRDAEVHRAASNRSVKVLRYNAADPVSIPVPGFRSGMGAFKLVRAPPPTRGRAARICLYPPSERSTGERDITGPSSTQSKSRPFVADCTSVRFEPARLVRPSARVEQTVRPERQGV